MVQKHFNKYLVLIVLFLICENALVCCMSQSSKWVGKYFPRDIRRFIKKNNQPLINFHG